VLHYLIQCNENEMASHSEEDGIAASIAEAHVKEMPTVPTDILPGKERCEHLSIFDCIAPFPKCILKFKARSLMKHFSISNRKNLWMKTLDGEIF
jgi:hypothetical protein